MREVLERGAACAGPRWSTASRRWCPGWTLCTGCCSWACPACPSPTCMHALPTRPVAGPSRCEARTPAAKSALADMCCIPTLLFPTDEVSMMCSGLLFARC